MSFITDYKLVAQGYDKERKPVASDVIASLLRTHSGKELKEMHICDIGCGTGNYAISLLEEGLGKISLLDANEEMLQKAKTKINGINKTASLNALVTSILPQIPFSDNSFDACMINMVLHHLEEKPDGVHFDGAMKTLQEVHRVLKPGGLISITAPTPTQMRGWWFLCLHEDTLCRFLKRFMSASQLRDMLVTLGFEVLHIIGIFGHELYASYSDLEWPLKPSFRQDVSYFSQATPEEQKEMIAFMEQMRNDGELQQFYETHDKSNEIGQFILCVVRRI